MIKWPSKDAEEILNYGFIWDTELPGGDVIVSSTWVVPPGLTKISEGKDQTRTVIKLSGGVEGETYEVHNLIDTTTSVEKIKQSAKLQIRER